eukprot:scaffold14246_cov105-Isochrysis_galbana.AAC.3
MDGSKVSLNSSCAHLDMSFSSHVLAAFQAAPRLAAAACSSAAAASLSSGLISTGVAVDWVRAQYKWSDGFRTPCSVIACRVLDHLAPVQQQGKFLRRGAIPGGGHAVAWGGLLRATRTSAHAHMCCPGRMCAGFGGTKYYSSQLSHRAIRKQKTGTAPVRTRVS